MRTIRVGVEIPVPDANQSAMAGLFGGGAKVHMSTEAIIASDDEAHEAGREASRVITEFIAGYTEAIDES